eukprot:TRINITY_DN15161_c0_g1_i1.p1 TRINITY_DN15161_c0_g1~~TRINITY_DN15161_c0_g1_i1.p1  ORF type:complete len:277 (-),score=69.72 TRINITY_DN15161_c0_g1_i1:303-1088(-)
MKGNVWVKSKALRDFKKENSTIKVILLSLDKAAAGTNLIEATHVILIDPPSGTTSQASATEKQAIGRACRQGQEKPVIVVRFIIRNTIEHDRFINLCNMNDKSIGNEMTLDVDFGAGDYVIGGTAGLGKATPWFLATQTGLPDPEYSRQGWQLHFSLDKDGNLTGGREGVREKVFGTLTPYGTFKATFLYLRGLEHVAIGNYDFKEKLMRMKITVKDTVIVIFTATRARLVRTRLVRARVARSGVVRTGLVQLRVVQAQVA